MSFIKNNDPRKTIVHHKNGIKTDYSIENLEWTTYKNNNQHAIDNGLRIYLGSYNGETHHFAKLTKEKVIQIKILLQIHSDIEIAKMFFVRPGTIHFIRTGKTWKILNSINKPMEKAIAMCERPEIGEEP